MTKLVRYSAQDIIDNFKLRLMGGAYQLLVGVEFHTIEGFLKAVKKTFSSRKTVNQYMGEIGNLKQKSNETIMQYACRTRELETASRLLKSFIDGTAHFIRTELRTSGSQDLTEAIADAIAIETSITPNPPNLSYNRNNSNRNPGGRYKERYTNTENRNYRFNYNQNRRYPDQQPQYADRNNDNFNRMDNRNNYNNNQTKKFYNDRNLDHENKRIDPYQNPQTRPPPKERQGYHNKNYRD
ncbi:hypothetical protein M0802_013533 [Mischocyttarus mexicanus]|nr:hypothetical protein M0802_013533 [Mischocyttarus mexicanus]